jgi:hypothetical protein
MTIIQDYTTSEPTSPPPPRRTKHFTWGYTMWLPAMKFLMSFTFVLFSPVLFKRCIYLRKANTVPQVTLFYCSSFKWILDTLRKELPSLNLFTIYPEVFRSRDSSVGITMGYGLDGRGSISGRAKRFPFTPQHPDQFWSPPSLLPNEYRGLVLRWKAARAWSWPFTSIYCRGQDRWSYTSTLTYIFMA